MRKNINEHMLLTLRFKYGMSVPIVIFVRSQPVCAKCLRRDRQRLDARNFDCSIDIGAGFMVQLSMREQWPMCA